MTDSLNPKNVNQGIEQIDSTIIKILIPVSLLVALYFVLNSINNTGVKGVLFIDYFETRKLDVVFSFIFMYIMIVFVALTIIFAYNQHYINDGKCDPLMFYLGSKRACRRTQYDNFENQDETILDKLGFLGEIVKTPFFLTYSVYLAILSTIRNFIEYTILNWNASIDYYIKTQTIVYNKINNILIDPILIKITDPLFKVFQYILDNTVSKVV